MRNYLVFRLHGPMVAWGDIAVGEHRPVFASPSKSAVMGLVAGALGIERQAEERHLELTDAFGMAVFTDRNGTLIRDYHTVQVLPSGTGRNRRRFATRREELDGSVRELATILSHRDYRCDASAWVALWAARPSDMTSLEGIAAALARPSFVPYLGRKSCPLSVPMGPRIVSAASVGEALEEYRASVPDLLWESASDARIVLSTEEVIGEDATLVVQRRDRLVSRRRWQFAARQEFMMSMPASMATEVQDVPEQN